MQGKAVGVKRCIINTEGKTLREAKFSGNKLQNYKFRKLFCFPLIQDTTLPIDEIDIFSKNGKYGFVNEDNTVLPAQFTEATPFKGGYAKVKKNGKYGILKLSSGNFQGMMVKNTVKVENGESETANYRIQMPAEYLNKPVKVEIEEENSGNKIVLSPTESSRDGKDYAFIPTLQDKETEKSYLFLCKLMGFFCGKTHNISPYNI